MKYMLCFKRNIYIYMLFLDIKKIFVYMIYIYIHSDSYNSMVYELVYVYISCIVDVVLWE